MWGPERVIQRGREGSFRFDASKSQRRVRKSGTILQCQSPSCPYALLSSSTPQTALSTVVSGCVCLFLQYLLQSCSRGGRGIVEDMCYQRRRAEACVNKSAQHALVNAGEREIV
jgi:hypothetical protein